MENRPGQPYVDQTTTTIVANHSWSTYCELTVQTPWETWPNWMLRGPCLHGPMSVAFFPLSRVLPLFHCPMALTGWGHYWIVRDGFGGHVIHGLHQTFIPASNSTMDRGERPDSKGQWIESRQSVTSNRMNGKQTWSTTLIKPPPLLLIFQSPYFLQELLSAYCFDSCKFSLHTNSCYWPMVSDHWFVFNE